MKKIVALIQHWFKEPEVCAPNYVVDTTRSNVFSTITPEESMMALREYGRLCHENKWLSHIEPEVMHNHLNMVNARLASKRKAEKYLVELCGKYHFNYGLFMDILDEEFTLVFVK